MTPEVSSSTAATTPTDEVIRAAGVLITRRSALGEVRFAVIHRPHRADWSLPKGKVELGESLPGTAVREVREETGLQVTLGHPLTTARYQVGGFEKSVHFWHSNSVEGEFTPSDEADQLRWLTREEALTSLTYDHDRALIAEALAVPATVPMLLVRHAHAGNGDKWRAAGKDDSLRPLTERGLRTVPLVAELANAYGVTQVFTSTAARCTQTVQGIDPEITRHYEPDLVDFLAAGHEGLLAVIARARSTGEPTVVCTHGDQLDWLVAHFGVAAFTFSKGGTLVVHWAQTPVTGPEATASAAPAEATAPVATEWYPAPA